MSKLQKFLDGKSYVPILTRFFGLHFGPFFANSSGHPGSQFGCFLLKLKNQEEQRASPKQVAKFLLPKKKSRIILHSNQFSLFTLDGFESSATANINIPSPTNLWVHILHTQVAFEHLVM
jgi:hypothetical protein